MLYPELISQRKVRSVINLLLLRIRVIRIVRHIGVIRIVGYIWFIGGSLFIRNFAIGKITGNPIHPSGEHHDSNKYHQNSANFHRILYDPLMLSEKIQYRARKQSHSQEWKDET